MLKNLKLIWWEILMSGAWSYTLVLSIIKKEYMLTGMIIVVLVLELQIIIDKFIRENDNNIIMELAKRSKQSDDSFYDVSKYNEELYAENNRLKKLLDDNNIEWEEIK